MQRHILKHIATRVRIAPGCSVCGLLTHFCSAWTFNPRDVAHPLDERSNNEAVRCMIFKFKKNLRNGSKHINY